jgi:hypothetical protein
VAAEAAARVQKSSSQPHQPSAVRCDRASAGPRRPMSLCGARWGAPRRSVRATVEALALIYPQMGERAGCEVVGGTRIKTVVVCG